MLPFSHHHPATIDAGVSRRDFLRASTLSAGAVGLSLAEVTATPAEQLATRREMNCIVLFLVGGPSQLDTWDPKPNAPAEIRGPFQPIQTHVSGIHLSELFPRMAKMADQYALIRSVHHKSPPIHETGHQLMQTGYLNRGDFEYPHYGSTLAYLNGTRSAILPGPIGYTGVSVGHGQSAGYLGSEYEPSMFDVETSGACEGYGDHTFGRSCHRARQLVESGVRFVTVNMFTSLFDEITWDCHADGGSLATTLEDYKTTLCPMFDQAYTALLTDLKQRGMLESTMVVAMGEFGRTPRLNLRGGRDHHPGAWTILFAGGGVRGGQVIGASDHHGALPHDRPVTPAEVAATVYHGLGVDLKSARIPDPDHRPVALVEAEPIGELFR